MAQRMENRKGAARPAAPEPERPPYPETPAAIGLRLKFLVFWAGGVLMALEIAGSRALAPHFGNSVFGVGQPDLGLPDRAERGLLSRRPAGRPVSFADGATRDLHLRFAVDPGRLDHRVRVLRIAGRRRAGRTERPASRQRGAVFAAEHRYGHGLAAGRPPGNPLGHFRRTGGRVALRAVDGGQHRRDARHDVRAGAARRLIGHFEGARILATAGGHSDHPRLVPASTLAGVLLAAAVGTVLFGWPESARTALRLGDRVVLTADTPYQHIAIVDNVHRHSRELRFNRYTESSIRTEPPYPTLCGYTNYFHLALLANPHIHRVLFIGAGGGVGPRAFHMHDPHLQIDVVDIDPKVLQIARKYFFLPDVPQIHTIAKDGRMYLRDTRATYDCIVLDTFTIGGRIPFHLVTKKFMTLCSRHMSADGVLVMNINSAWWDPARPFSARCARPWKRCFRSPTRSPWTIACAAGRDDQRHPAGHEVAAADFTRRVAAPRRTSSVRFVRRQRGAGRGRG